MFSGSSRPSSDKYDAIAPTLPMSISTALARRVSNTLSLSSPSSRDGAPKPKVAKPGYCLKCTKKKCLYECMPCGHAAFCKACAMKMATGGKCKVCGDLYMEVRKIRK